MAIFPRLDLEKQVQVDDATRLDATRSFVSKGEAAITLVEIEPEASAGFIDVTGSSSKDYFLDWQYTGATRTVDITVRVTTDGAPVTYTEQMEVLSVADDMLFSNDQELIDEEEEILKFLPEGRRSYLNVHRRSQKKIVEWFNEIGVTDSDNQKLRKENFVDIEEVKQWSIYLTLQLIYEDLSNVVDDIFSLKSQKYGSMAVDRQKRAVFRFDFNNDGEVENQEGVNIQTKDLVRT